ncbi:MAG: hypothetical protein IKO62_11260 [Bacteroidales bacterium]|nr:hypothetical protein [Bacteroidales bacterium]
MRREHELEQSVIPEPVHWFPLTQNNGDIMGNFPVWSYSIGITYSDNGGFFNGNAYAYKTLANIPNTNFQTFSVQIMLPTVYSSGIYTLFNFDVGNTNTGIGALIAPDWGGDLIDNPTYNGNTNTDLSIGSIPWIANTWYTLVWRQDFTTKTELFVNGSLRSSTTIYIPSNVVYSRVYIGTHPNNSNRKFKGYIKNIRMWDCYLTDEQIAAL